MTAGPERAGAAPDGSPWLDRRRALRLVVQLGVLALGVHLLLPQVAGLERTAERLARTTWWLPVLLLALEAASLVAYAEVVRTGLLRGGAALPRALVVRCVLVGNGLGRALPAGTAASFAVTVGSFRRAGADGVQAAVSVAGAGLLSSATLAALLPAGVLLALLTERPTRVVLTAAAAATAVLVGAALLPRATRDPVVLGDRVRALLVRLVPGRWQRRVDPARLATVVEDGARGVRDLASDRRALGVAGGWALANWLLDAAVLLVLALTIGHGTPVSALLLAYAVGMLVASLPLTPGGVGLVEPVMIGLLVGAGAPAAAATVTVLGWRLVGHWLPIGVGLLLLPGLGRRGTPASRAASRGGRDAAADGRGRSGGRG